MRILGIESSSLVASAAVVENEVTLAEYTVNYKKTHSQTLLPMIDEMMRLLDMEPSAVDAIAVSGGPGSFTGLRIGSATAKGLGTGFKETVNPCSDAGRDGVWTFWRFRADLPDDGCQAAAGLYRNLPVRGAV